MKSAGTGELLGALKERAKELDCLYRVEECLGNPDGRWRTSSRAW